MAERYANMEEDGDGEPVEECIEADDGGDENFLDIVDNFDGLSDEDDEDVSFVSMGGKNVHMYVCLFVCMRLCHCIKYACTYVILQCTIFVL